MTKPTERAYFQTALQQAEQKAAPYRHFLLRNSFSHELLTQLSDLDLAPACLCGLSGKREYHNDQRHYFTPEARAHSSAVAEVSNLFRSVEILDAIEALTETRLSGSYLRIEYAQDVDGFWLEPHTDLGVKIFTGIFSIAAGQEHLGTDLYATPHDHVATVDFSLGAGLIFIPDAATWHGFQPRPIKGVRKSLIVNYVTHEWRAREQLAFEDPVYSEQATEMQLTI